MSATQKAKKLALGLATFALMTVANMGAVFAVASSINISTVVLSREALVSNNFPTPLKRVLYIHHLIQFKKNQAKVQALLDSGSKLNAMTPTYTARLSLKVQSTIVGTQKIDGSTFKTFEIVLASFQVKHKPKRASFFLETFLVADTRLAIILGMPFLTLSNVNVLFAEREFT